MDMILWRHAEAEDEREGLADIDRALTALGRKQAARVGRWLHRQLPRETRVLCSPALRCQQTALALGREFAIIDSIGPDVEAAAVLQAAGWPDAAGPVLVVGHQPTLGQALAQVLRLQDGDCAIPKGSAWWLRTRDRDGGRQTVVWAVRPPGTA